MRSTFTKSVSWSLSIPLLVASVVSGTACDPGPLLPPATGGGVATGGVVGAGGMPPTTGGSVGVGGSVGGGGTIGAGGAIASGGTGSGGETAGDGGTGSGGGGTGTSGEWGLVEDPGAGCTIPAIPEFSSLTADPKLPDPFTKMDGTRMTDKSEWLCRRKELLEQSKAFIYGDKPVPEEGSVSGTVSNTMITVNAEGPEGTATFTVTVNMNGATGPAPAIIGYGGVGGMPVPSGVATLNFSPIEASGGSGAKNGPFFTAYGSDHEAGYLTAQAWQISRVLDVLEQNPGVIDPQRVGVTGCSRYGKGAFVAGVLDNRIALTIPVESGISGTVALRLIEVLGGGEWPYHGISYVRWHSEVALGQFTNANSAAGDNTDKLPIDMHEMMAMIVPRGLYIVDNPSTNYAGLDRDAAWVTGNVGKMVFEALGVGDHFSYQGASGPHCSWRSQYTPSLNAMVDKFLKGNDAAETGNVDTDFSGPNHLGHIDWEPPTLTGEL